MEGLEAVELNSIDFKLDNFDFRLDSEYFLKSNLSLIKKLDKIGFRRIGEFSYVTDGIHTSIDYSETSNINLISATSPRENYFDVSRKAFISEVAHLNNPRTALKENDLIISTVGTIGNCAVATKDILPANSDRHVGIVRVNKEFLPNFISTFLLTKYGRFQTWRESTGNVQLNLFLYKIRTLKIANLSKAFQIEIDKLVKLAHSKREFSKQTYSSAETLLLETLGLSNFEPSAEPVNVKGFKESFLTTGRLDAEYYQKKYDCLEKAICTTNYKRIKEIRTVNFRGMQPEYVENGSLDVINSKHILEDTLDYNGFEKTSDEYWDIQERARVFKGDILTYTTGANIGRTQVYRLDKKALASNHVNILRLKEGNPFYIGFVLNSMIGRMQTEKYCAGSAQVELYPKDLDEFIIPIIDKTIQNQIIDLTEESFHLKKQSEQLLETAKRAVEIAIEQDEEAALRYIEAQRD
ncbi:restriction endonuclease subunit S [Gaoshiqia sp. Z1-71]|uniref:restriction endonuclease subunit S n=1 Tax=Gaoshiqia hydrogeniformans TaxID=3290090 RepID=UPI003BF852FC